MITCGPHKRLAGSLALAILILLPGVLVCPAAGTETYMLRLPASSKFGCQNCHTTATPSPGEAGLNVFGNDFRDNSFLWDRALAEMNSDGDKCTNGFELGDRDGDGRYDFSGEAVENSNPATKDCTLPVQENTWGIIKEIFSNELRQYEEALGWDWDDSELLAMYFP